MAQVVYDGNPAEYEHLIRDGYEFKLGEYVNRGWELFKQDIGGFVGFTLLTALISFLIGLIPILGMLIQIVITYPLAAGVYIVGNKIAKGEPHEFKDFFSGFDHLVQLSVGYLVMIVLLFIATILLVIPGIYLAVAYAFVIPIIVLGKFEFWPALELSRKVITKNWWNFLLLAIVSFGILVIGFAALIVGLFAAIPVISLIYYSAYDDILGNSETTTFDDRIEEIGTKDAGL